MIIEDKTYDQNGYVTLPNAQYRKTLISEVSY